MLQITVEGREFFNEETSEFIPVKKTTLRLEHSLVSISKWESKWKKAFLDPRRKSTKEESIDYIKCMTLNQNVDPNVYLALTAKQFTEINDYINSELTATWFNDTTNKAHSRRVVTSELIYYWMTAHSIPFECQKWHVSRLLTLIQICNLENDPDKKKMSKNKVMRQNASLNAARRARFHSKG